MSTSAPCMHAKSLTSALDQAALHGLVGADCRRSDLIRYFCFWQFAYLFILAPLYSATPSWIACF